MRRAFLVLFLAACSSPAAPAPGMYPGAPQVPGMYPGAPQVPGMPGAPGVPGQFQVPTAPVGQMPGFPPVAQMPVPPIGQPVLAPAVAGPAPLPPGFRQITGAGFSFGVPATWIDIPPPLPQVVVAARDTNQLGQLFVNANVVTEPFPLSDGAAYGQANLAGLGQAAAILGQRPSMTGTHTGLDIEARWSNATPVYRTLQRLTAANGTGYVLTCTADDTAFEQARATCAAVLDTFRVMP